MVSLGTDCGFWGWQTWLVPITQDDAKIVGMLVPLILYPLLRDGGTDVGGLGTSTSLLNISAVSVNLIERTLTP